MFVMFIILFLERSKLYGFYGVIRISKDCILQNLFFPLFLLVWTLRRGSTSNTTENSGPGLIEEFYRLFIVHHSEPKVASYYFQIVESFANYFINTKAKAQVLHNSNMSKARKKYKWASEVKSKAKGFRRRRNTLKSI